MESVILPHFRFFSGGCRVPGYFVNIFRRDGWSTEGPSPQGKRTEAYGGFRTPQSNHNEHVIVTRSGLGSFQQKNSNIGHFCCHLGTGIPRVPMIPNLGVPTVRPLAPRMADGVLTALGLPGCSQVACIPCRNGVANDS